MKTMRNSGLAVLAMLVVMTFIVGRGPLDSAHNIAAAGAAPAGKYASVNGLKLYYEIHGTGRPLVLLHGALCTIDGCFGKILPLLARTRRVIAIRLLPGFDQYVLGPGTADGHVVPAARRSAVSKQSGWISPIVVAGGVVRGTWELDGDRAHVAWFREAGKPPRKPLEAEVARLSTILERDLRAVISLA